MVRVHILIVNEIVKLKEKVSQERLFNSEQLPMQNPGAFGAGSEAIELREFVEYGSLSRLWILPTSKII